MVQAGLSRELFDAWCEDARNGIIICDFAVQGTLAREVLGEPTQVVTRSGRKVCTAWHGRPGCTAPAAAACSRSASLHLGEPAHVSCSPLGLHAVW